eukprot:TRINITY_DN12012_c0_g1_i1.p1 TRINITY_DN12012_c0_g1~~TRINITY_DN12012_c0_g1_i1.p1  ORF type:complete len:1166 (+),score=134.47 TRINITY_DN12012_c0_g1_i1:63-3560(+)
MPLSDLLPGLAQSDEISTQASGLSVRSTHQMKPPASHVEPGDEDLLSLLPPGPSLEDFTDVKRLAAIVTQHLQSFREMESSFNRRLRQQEHAYQELMLRYHTMVGENKRLHDNLGGMREYQNSLRQQQRDEAKRSAGVGAAGKQNRKQVEREKQAQLVVVKLKSVVKRKTREREAAMEMYESIFMQDEDARAFHWNDRLNASEKANTLILDRAPQSTEDSGVFSKGPRGERAYDLDFKPPSIVRTPEDELIDALLRRSHFCDVLQQHKLEVGQQYRTAKIFMDKCLSNIWSTVNEKSVQNPRDNIYKEIRTALLRTKSMLAEFGRVVNAGLKKCLDAEKTFKKFVAAELRENYKDASCEAELPDPMIGILREATEQLELKLRREREALNGERAAMRKEDEKLRQRVSQLQAMLFELHRALYASLHAVHTHRFKWTARMPDPLRELQASGRKRNLHQAFNENAPAIVSQDLEYLKQFRGYMVSDRLFGIDMSAQDPTPSSSFSTRRKRTGKLDGADESDTADHNDTALYADDKDISDVESVSSAGSNLQQEADTTAETSASQLYAESLQVTRPRSSSRLVRHAQRSTRLASHAQLLRPIQQAVLRSVSLPATSINSPFSGAAMARIAELALTPGAESAAEGQSPLGRQETIDFPSPSASPEPVSPQSISASSLELAKLMADPQTEPSSPTPADKPPLLQLGEPELEVASAREEKPVLVPTVRGLLNAKPQATRNNARLATASVHPVNPAAAAAAIAAQTVFEQLAEEISRRPTTKRNVTLSRREQRAARAQVFARYTRPRSASPLSGTPPTGDVRQSDRLTKAKPTSVDRRGVDASSVATGHTDRRGSTESTPILGSIVSQMVDVVSDEPVSHVSPTTEEEKEAVPSSAARQTPTQIGEDHASVTQPPQPPGPSQPQPENPRSEPATTPSAPPSASQGNRTWPIRQRQNSGFRRPPAPLAPASYRPPLPSTNAPMMTVRAISPAQRAPPPPLQEEAATPAGARRISAFNGIFVIPPSPTFHRPQSSPTLAAAVADSPRQAELPGQPFESQQTAQRTHQDSPSARRANDVTLRDLVLGAQNQNDILTVVHSPSLGISGHGASRNTLGHGSPARSPGSASAQRPLLPLARESVPVRVPGSNGAVEGRQTTRVVRPTNFAPPAQLRAPR